MIYFHGIISHSLTLTSFKLPIVFANNNRRPRCIHINNCGPAICCFVYSILTSYYESNGNHSYLSTNRPLSSGYDLSHELNARCYTFCVHSRKLCYSCWICSNTQTDPGLLLTNKRSTKNDTVNSCYKEQNVDYSSTSFNDDGFVILTVRTKKSSNKKRKQKLRTPNIL